MKRLDNRAETIVEVLIVMAVLSSVLASSFVLTSQSVRANRESQERSRAVGYAQNQLERLKTIVGDGDTTTPDRFCISDTGVMVAIPAGVYATVGNSNQDADNFSNYPVACRTGFYNTVTVYDNPNPPTNGTKTFTSYVRWDKIGKAGHNNVILNYRTQYIRDAAGTPAPSADTETAASLPSGDCDTPAVNDYIACFYNETSGAINPFYYANKKSNGGSKSINLDTAGSPYPPLVNADFSVRWRGNFSFIPGNYRFTIRTEGHARLYIDDTLVKDLSGVLTPTPLVYFVDTPMLAGTRKIRYEYFDVGGQATAQLDWVPISAIEAETFSSDGCFFPWGYSVSGTYAGVLFMCTNGTRGTTVTTDDFDYMTVTATGSKYLGVDPVMIVTVDGVVYFTGTVSSASYNDYTIPIPTGLYKAGNHQFQISFVNDGAGPGGDRNLYPDKINIWKKSPFGSLRVPPKYAMLDPRRKYS